MSIIIEHPSTREPERLYIYKVVFDEMLGIDWESRSNPLLQDEVKIYSADQSENIRFPDLFFAKFDKIWLEKESLPIEPLNIIDFASYDLNLIKGHYQIPAIYGLNHRGKFDFPIDVFGSCFFLLTRYEEAVSVEMDLFERFPASASLASRELFLERPLVNEYVEILWNFLKRTFPGLIRKKHKYNFYVSCDVDTPFDDALWKWKYMLRRSIGDAFKRKSFSLCMRTWRNFFDTKKYGLSNDPYYTFDWMMEICEKNNIRNSFYFISDHSSKLDGTYSLAEDRIQKLMRNIHDRGHQLGLHGSFNSYNNRAQLQKEFDILRATCEKLNIHQSDWGGRQHVLRFDVNSTLDIWDAIGMNYDATLGFADHVGFRTGCCHAHSTFSLRRRKHMKLVERPLVAMEVTLTEPRYMNLGYSEEMAEYIVSLCETVKYYNGEFSLLWHNSNFTHKKSKEIYADILSKCK